MKFASSSLLSSQLRRRKAGSSACQWLVLMLSILTVPAATAPPPNARQHWAFHPPRDQTPPKVKNARWAKTDIDRFILARLEAAGIAPAPPADPRTLMRRMNFDLTGLPPTNE